MALVGVELETFVSEPDALTTRPPTLNNTFLTILKLVSNSITNNNGLETTRAINAEKHSKSANYFFNNFIQIEIRSLSCKVNDVISQHSEYALQHALNALQLHVTLLE